MIFRFHPDQATRGPIRPSTAAQSTHSYAIAMAPKRPFLIDSIKLVKLALDSTSLRKHERMSFKLFLFILRAAINRVC